MSHPDRDPRTATTPRTFHGDRPPRYCDDCGHPTSATHECPSWDELEAEADAVMGDTPAVTETIHACPPPGSGLMPCCGRTPFEAPRTDRMTEDPEQVTCGTSGVTIDGAPAVVISIAELNTLTARMHEAEAVAARPGDSQARRAAAFNAIAPALHDHDQWLPLTVRQAVADAVLAAIGTDARITPDNPAASTPGICELPHQTIEEEDDCERRRTAASDDGLRKQYAAAMREHYLVTNREEADADGNMPCRCGDWREPGPMGTDEEDWDSHLADAILAVRDAELQQLRAKAEALKTTARVAPAMHRSAEDTVTRLIDLHEHWIQTGAPRLGTSIARWWDARLAEHRAALNRTEAGQ